MVRISAWEHAWETDCLLRSWSCFSKEFLYKDKDSSLDLSSSRQSQNPPKAQIIKTLSSSCGKLMAHP